MIEFLRLWERLHNPDFKPFEFEGLRKQAGANAFIMSPKNCTMSRSQWKTIIRETVRNQELKLVFSDSPITGITNAEDFSCNFAGLLH